MCLLVDGTRFLVSPKLLTAKPDTMLGRMFSLRANKDSAELVSPNDRQEFEVDLFLSEKMLEFEFPGGRGTFFNLFPGDSRVLFARHDARPDEFVRFRAERGLRVLHHPVQYSDCQVRYLFSNSYFFTFFNFQVSRFARSSTRVI